MSYITKTVAEINIRRESLIRYKGVVSTIAGIRAIDNGEEPAPIAYEIFTINKNTGQSSITLKPTETVEVGTPFWDIATPDDRREIKAHMVEAGIPEIIAADVAADIRTANDARLIRLGIQESQRK